MATAVAFAGTNIPGVVLRGVRPEPRRVQNRTVKFWGVVGESRIDGEPGGRTITIPILIHDGAASTFDSARKMSDYLEVTLYGLQGTEGTVAITSGADWDDFDNCVFEGFSISEPGILHDDAGSLGGNWFVQGILTFRQLQ